MKTEEETKDQEARIRGALHLVKLHITEEETEQNRQLHQAVQLMVTFARKEGYLL